MKHTTATGQLSNTVTTTPIRGYTQFAIRARGVSISQALRNHIERRVHFALDRSAGRIRKVHATLGDLNGPRGGIDKRPHCRNPLRSISGLLFRESPSMVVPSDPQPGDAP